MTFYVDSKVLALGFKIKVIAIKGIDNQNNSLAYSEWRREKVQELITKYQDYDIHTDPIIEGFYAVHEKAGIPRRKNPPASENLIRLLEKRQELVPINKAVDIYNLISLDSKLCLGAHDLDHIAGDVFLKITVGNEKFCPIGNGELKEIRAGEFAFVDGDNDVICWADIRQVAKTQVTLESKNILYFIAGNTATAEKLLDQVAKEIGDVTTKFCGGTVEEVPLIVKNL